MADLSPAKKSKAAVSKKPRATPAPRWRACSRCGRTRPCPPGGMPNGWSYGWDGKRAEYLCVDCSRASIRSIEGRLTAEYWE